MINVKVNASQVAQNLGEWTKNFEQMVSKGVANAAFAIEAQAKRNVPTHTGELRRSIQTQTEGTAAVVSSNLEYAPYVECGTGIYADGGNGRQEVPWTFYDLASGEFIKTSGIPAAHYLQDAVDAIAPRLGDYIKEALEK